MVGEECRVFRDGVDDVETAAGLLVVGDEALGVGGCGRCLIIGFLVIPRYSLQLIPIDLTECLR